MGSSKGSKGRGTPKAKAAPIARPSHDYKASIGQREYTAEEKVEREELRRLEAKTRQLARDGGFAVDLGAAGDQWDKAAKNGTAGPPPGSGYSGKGGAKGGKSGKGGGKRSGKPGGGGKSKSGGSGQISRAPTPHRNQGHLAADPSQAWANYAGSTTPVGGQYSSSRARPVVQPAVASGLIDRHLAPSSKPVLRSAAEVASSSRWENYTVTAGTAPVESSSWYTHGGSADVPADPDAPPWNETSWHDRPWHDNSGSDDRWEDNSWNWSQTDAGTSSSSTGNAAKSDPPILSPCQATNVVNNPLDIVETMTRERVGDRRPHVASGEHCEVLKHSQIGCAVVSLESSDLREALMTSIKGRSPDATPEMTVCGVTVTVQRHTDKETGLAVETDIFLGWGRAVEKNSPVAADDIAKAIDATLAGLGLPKPAPPASDTAAGSEDKRRRFKTYLWHMAAQGQVQKGKTVLRMAAAANQVSGPDIEAVIAEFEANSISQNDDFEADDYDDEYDDTDVGTDVGTSHVDEEDEDYVVDHSLAPISESAEPASCEHGDSQQAYDVRGADFDACHSVAIPDTDSDDDL